MTLPEKSIQGLREILEKDYGQKLSSEQATELGVSLLRLTRVALTALARDKDKEVSTGVLKISS